MAGHSLDHRIALQQVSLAQCTYLHPGGSLVVLLQYRYLKRLTHVSIPLCYALISPVLSHH